MGVSREEQAFAAAALVEGLQAGAPLGFSVHDERLRYELVSPSLAAMNGRPVAEHIGRRVTEIVPGELGERVEALVAAVRDSGAARTGVELEGPTATSKEPRTWVGAYYPIRLDRRRLVGVVVVDVTDRRRAQRDLRESERVLSGAQRMAELGWWTWTAEPEAVVYAPELLTLMGRDPALGGTPQALDLLGLADTGELRSVRAEARAAISEQRPFARRIRARRADGELRLLDGRASIVRDEDGRPVGLRGFVQDITGLERAGRRQRLVAELGAGALANLDLDALLRRTIDTVDAGLTVDAAAVLELSPGRDDELLVRAAKGDAGPWTPRTSISERALSTRQTVLTGSSVTVVIGGRGRPFGLLGAASSAPGRFDEDDATFLQALANVVADAVERRLAEAEIAELSAARGRLVAQALDAEERARRRISENLHDGALQELLAARHDLYALTGRGGDDGALQQARERLGDIVSKLREVMSALHPTVLQYGGMEAALHAVADQQAHAGGFEAHVAIAPGAVGARDELLLSVARELLANAARHAAARHVRAELGREDSRLVLTVSDDGAGMGPERPAQALAEGRIGLASCRERMEAVGGTFAVESAPGAGTRVRACAPVPGPTTGISGLAGSRHGA